jgi:hypothetical protein
MEEERKKDKAQRGSDLLFATGDLCSERPAHGSVRGREGLCVYSQLPTDTVARRR